MLSAVLISGNNDFEAAYRYIRSLSLGALDLYGHLAGHGPLGPRGGELYQSRCVLAFQEWYLGDSLFREKWGREPRLPGKKGLFRGEQPIVPIGALTAALGGLKRAGLSMGIGTGRVGYETDFPLDEWDIRKYFDESRLITYDYVIEAEKLTEETVTKPHPYMFLKGMLGADYDDARILRGEYDKTLATRTLVIGDAGADILSAKAAGMDFAAVLTSVSGQSARGYFERQGAEYILDDVTGLVEN